MDESVHKIIVNTVERVREGGRYQGRQRPHRPGDVIDATDLGELLGPETTDDPSSVVTVEYLDTVVVHPVRFYTVVLTPTDISNRYLFLPAIPTDLLKVMLLVNQAPGQVPVLDYVVEPGGKINWNGRGLDGVLASGDVMQVLYA